MAKKKLSEAAADILNANVKAKQAQGEPFGLNRPLVTPDGEKEEYLGIDDYKTDQEVYRPQDNMKQAIPPGATPPVGAEPMGKLAPQPQETMGRQDLVIASEQGQTYPDSYEDIRDRIMGKVNSIPPTMQPNPNAPFPKDMVPEEKECEEETLKDEDEKKEKEKEKEYKKKIKEDIDALLSGEELSEEFKEKASIIFEAAVLSRVEEITENYKTKLEDEYETLFAEAIEELQKEYEEKTDKYLSYVAESWLEENKIAIEKGLKLDIMENFFDSLKNLFLEHNIMVPEEKVDVVEELTVKVEELESKLNNSLKESIELKNKLSLLETNSTKTNIVESVCTGLTLVQAEKIKSYAEKLDFISEEDFNTKVKTLKESYFPSTKTSKEDLITEEVVENDIKISDPTIDNYVKAISNIIRK